MEKFSLKIGLILALLMLMMIPFARPAEAYSGTTKIIDRINEAQKTVSSKRHNANTPIDGKFYFGYNLLFNTGIYCLDHHGAAYGSRTVLFKKHEQKDDTTISNCNNMAYLFGCGKTDSSNYRTSLIQNYIWHKPSLIITDKKATDPFWQVSYNFKAMENANKVYNENKKDIKEGAYAQIDSDLSDVDYVVNDSALKIQNLKMNDYTLVYNENCSYVNNRTKYNSYANVKEIPKRSGLLSGIVDATVKVYCDGKSKTLKYTNGDFKFTYENAEKRKKGYYAFPKSKEKFNIVIDRDKIKGIIKDKKAITVTIKFKSIKVLADEITKASIFKQIADKKMQPLLAVSAGMKTYSKTKGVKIKIILTDIIEQPPGDVKINTWIVDVKGGGENGLATYHYKEGEIQHRVWEDEPHRELQQSNRAKWTETQKWNDRAVVEWGDTITFRIKITNNSNADVTVKNVTWKGCNKNGKLWDSELVRKNGGSITKEVTIENVDKFANSEEKRRLTAKIEKFTSNGKTIDCGERYKSEDFFTYKNYYVTVDKYIDTVDGTQAELGAAKDSGTPGTMQDEEDNYGETGGDKPEGPDGEESKDIESDSGEVREIEHIYLTWDGDFGTATDMKSYFYYYDKDAESDESNPIIYRRMSEMAPNIYLEVENSEPLTATSAMENIFVSEETKEINGTKYYIIYEKASTGIACYKGTDGKYYYFNKVGEFKEATIKLDSAHGNLPYIVNEKYVDEPVRDPEDAYYYFEMSVGVYIKVSDYIVNKEQKNKMYFDYERYLNDHPYTDQIGDGLIPSEGEGDSLEDDSDVTDAAASLKTDESGNVVHESTYKHQYFYEVKDTNGNVACYWHPGLSKEENGPFFIYNEEEKRYSAVYAEKTGEGKETQWHIDPSEAIDDGKIYLQADKNGSVMIGSGGEYQEIKDQTGTTVKCYFKDGRFYTKDSDGAYHEVEIKDSFAGPYIGAEVEADGEREDRTYRNNTPDDTKQENPVMVENGNKVQYKIVVYNTQKRKDSWGIEKRTYAAFWKPAGVVVDVKDSLPTDCIKSGKIHYSYESNDGKFTKEGDINFSSNITFKDVPVPPGGYTTITYTVEIESDSGEVQGENKATLDKVRNANGKEIEKKNLNQAPDERKTSSDYFGEGQIPQTPEDEVSGTVKVTRVQHNSDTGVKTTYQDEVGVDEAYAEYGDRVEFTIKVNNTYTAKESYNFDCWQGKETTEFDKATVTMRLELPEEIYQESSKYKILIDGQQYDINTSQRTGVMWQFENRPEIKDNGKITGSLDECQTGSHHRTFCSLYSCWTVHYDDWSHHYTRYTKSGKSTTCKLTDNTTKVEIVNISNDKDVDVSKLTLKASLVNIVYEHAYGWKYAGPYDEEGYTYAEHDCGYSYRHWCKQGEIYKKTFDYTAPSASKSGGSCSTGIHKWSTKDEANEGKIIWNTTGEIENKAVESWSGGVTFDQAHYKMNDYSLQVDQYVNQYNGEMETYNRAHKFSTETGNYKVENNTTNKNYDANPQMVEKYETMTLLTVATNVAPSSEEDENNTGSPGKYKTRVRPDIIYQTLDAGLKVIPNTVRIKKNNGQDITNMFVSTLNEAENRMEYVVIQGDNELATTLLSPGETIYYYVDVHVIESNMSLDTIRSTSVSMQLSNVNHQKVIDSEFRTDGQKKKRIVYIPLQNNVCKQNSDIVSFKMKDLIMAGTVWVDGDRDGYKNSGNDKVKKDVVVHLYKTTDGGSNGTKVKTVTTREDGTYTFDRQKKTDNGTTHNAYYIEFEYDGLFYKASEVYGGVNTGEADGAANLDGSTGNYAVQWLQGHDDLTSTVPYTNRSEGAGPISGKTEYMTDSNAYEFDDVRNSYDAKHEKMAYNATYNNSLTKTDDLAYTKNDHVSKLDERATGERIMTARSFIKQSYNSSEVSSKDANNTNTLFLNQYASYNRKTPTPKPETEYLKYVNLSLVRREEVDLSIDADVYSVKTTVNGEEMQYVFDENQANSADDSYETKANPYKLAQESVYNLNLYKSDYYYRYDDYYGKEDYYGEKVDESGGLMEYKSPDSEENIEVTYRVCVRNKVLNNDEPHMATGQDIPVQTALNELVVYYDSKFRNAINETTPVRIKNENTGLWDTKQLPNVYARYSRNESDLNKVGVNGLNHETLDGTGAKKLDIKNTGSAGPNGSRFSNNRQVNEGESGDTGYSILHLSSNDLDNEYLSEGESLYIDITFIVRKGDIIPEDKMNGDYQSALKRTLDMYSKNDLALEMVAEVGGYTTKYREDYAHKGLAGHVAGLVDRDSNPSNLEHINDGQANNQGENWKRYEDDTYAVGVKIGLYPDNTPPPETPPPPGTPPPETPPPSTEPAVRRLKGMVWDDARSTTATTASGDSATPIQYIGNGQYIASDANDGKAKTNSVLNPGVNNDTPIAGVKVTLMEIAQTATGQYYEYPARYAYTWTDQYGVKHNKGEKIEFVTGTKAGNMYDGAAQGSAYEDGSYLFQNFITGYYIVRFDYGYDKNKPENIIYNGQDYKSTQYFNPKANSLNESWTTKGGNAYYQVGWKNHDNIGVKSVVNNPEVDVKKGALSVNSDNSDDFYYNKVKEALQIDNRVSDAQDDEIRRLNVNAYSEVTTTTQAQVFSETVAFAPELTQNTAMYADSTIFYVNPENGKCEDRKIDYRKAESWNLKNLDFGIEYRPEASIVLDKDISTVELVTTDGDTLLKLFFETQIQADGTEKRIINTTKSVGHENVQFIPNSGTDGKGKQGIVYINMDTDILEGAIMNVEYEFDATNHSEVDRINKNLNDIRFETVSGEGLSGIGATNKKYSPEYKVGATINPELSKQEKYRERNYSANKTASKTLQLLYYAKKDTEPFKYEPNESEFTVESDKHKYLKKLKKPYQSSGTYNNVPTGDGTKKEVTLLGTEYYGMYLGQTYYRGEVGNNDEVVDLKVDNLMDYLDNNLTFSATSNSTDNHLWSAKRSEELATVIDWSMASVKQGLVPSDVANKYYMYNVYEKYDDIGNIVKCYANNPSLLLDMNKRKEARAALVDFRKHIIYGELVDANDVKYDTKDRSNLLMSVDSNRIGNKADVSPGNKELSRFLATTKKVSPINTAKSDKTTGEINLIASKVLSAVDLEEGTSLTYGNYAEVVQYRLLTGRRTKLPDDDIRGGLIAQGPPETPPDDIGRTDPDPEPGEDTPIGREPTEPPLDDPNPIGSNRLDPDSPEGSTPIGRKEITTDSGDFTEMITISPPTGLKQD